MGDKGAAAQPDYNAEYVLGEDSKLHTGVPLGMVSAPRTWRSHVFEGTERNYWTYVPAQYDASRPACLMVFQDGGGFVTRDGGYCVPNVLDNLIHSKELPVTIGLFVSPGAYPGRPVPEYLPDQPRQVEYDTLSDRYSKLLLEELIPEVRKEWALTDDPEGWGIGGASSGAICAWTVAWERPDRFRKVLSIVGSFENIRGGHNYPSLVRRTPRKPIRIFLQSGAHDLDWEFGHWPLANQQMAAALKFAGYDYQFVFGNGTHSGQHGAAILPDAMRWLWRDYPRPA